MTQTHHNLKPLQDATSPSASPEHRDSGISVTNLAELITLMKKHQGHQWTSNANQLCTWFHQPTHPPVRISLLVTFSKPCRAKSLTIILPNSEFGRTVS